MCLFRGLFKSRPNSEKVKLRSTYTDRGTLWCTRTLLNSDFVVSMPKMKDSSLVRRHPELKNMFGGFQAHKYGWPEEYSPLRKESTSCVVDLCATVPIYHFVIGQVYVAVWRGKRTP